MDKGGEGQRAYRVVAFGSGDVWDDERPRIVEIYDPSQSESGWRLAGDLPGSLRILHAVVCNGLVYATAFGHGYDFGILRFNITDGTSNFVQLPSIEGGNIDYSCRLFTCRSRVLVAGIMSHISAWPPEPIEFFLRYQLEFFDFNSP